MTFGEKMIMFGPDGKGSGANGNQGNGEKEGPIFIHDDANDRIFRDPSIPAEVKNDILKSQGVNIGKED